MVVYFYNILYVFIRVKGLKEITDFSIVNCFELVTLFNIFHTMYITTKKFDFGILSVDSSRFETRQVL